MPAPSKAPQRPPAGRSGSVRAQLHFTPPMIAVPTLDITGGNRGKLKLEPREVELADADALSPAPSLASHGFEAVPFAASPPETEGQTTPQYRRAFANLCAAAVRKATGAPLVIGIASAVQIRRSAGVMEEATISVVHTDFTPSGALLRIRQMLALSGHKGPIRRFAAYNTWWLAREGPQDRPLALCDATSIAAPDIQYGRAHVLAPDASEVDYGEVAFLRYSPRQRWYFYPRLDPDRLLVFCGFDSDPTRPSMVTHSAFTNPDCPAGAPPRVSIESRCLAIW